MGRAIGYSRRHYRDAYLAGTRVQLSGLADQFKFCGGLGHDHHGYNLITCLSPVRFLSNGDLRITQRVEIVDTLIGTPMGTSAASAGGAGSALMSNRYVMLQSYSVQNISGATIDNVQLFQLLHGLNSQFGVYDNRIYSGPLSITNTTSRSWRRPFKRRWPD